VRYCIKAGAVADNHFLPFLIPLSYYQIAPQTHRTA
jgi:hypothetical protein